MNKEMMKGSIDLILLSILAKKDMYGYEMVQVLKQSSDDTYSMSEGTLYPALKRLEMQGAIKSYWQEEENIRPRKYYQITEYGQGALQSKLKDFQQIHEIISKWNKSGVAYDKCI